MTIREQVIVIDGVEYLGPPKSAAGVRVLALDEVSVRILWALWREQLRRYGRVDPKARVFRHQTGRPVRPDWLTRRFAKLGAELTHLSTTLVGADDRHVTELVERLRPRRREPAGYAADVNAGTVDDHIGRFRELAEAGVAEVMVGLPDLTDAEPVHRMARIIAAFR